MSKNVQKYLNDIIKSRGMEDELVIVLCIEAENGATVEQLEAIASDYEAEE